MMLLIAYSFLLFTNRISASPTDRIVGGSTVKIEDYPHQASLRIGEDLHVCGGSIIGIDWILTAAHCAQFLIITEVLRPTVVVGTSQLSHGGWQYLIEKIIAHDDYESHLLKNDIALIKLTTNLDLSNAVNIIPYHSSTPPIDSICEFTGWGYTSASIQSPPNNLQHTQFITMSLNECKRVLSVSNTNLCTRGYRDKGTCYGDSGSALIFKGRQVGVASFRVPCGTEKPDVFTSVPKFASWIEEQSGISGAFTATINRNLLALFLVTLYIVVHLI
ncbi:hypothetical protein FQR65_LT01986 [Abscondita terminalis]|nr:hypothetical protein FQR65_LT01986 [Abscondita terminalis]